MILLPIVNTAANQSFNITLDGTFYTISLRTAINVTLMDVTRGSELVVSGKRCPPQQFMLMKYQQAEYGNFVFWNDDQNYPFWTDFGVTTFLVYYSPEELKVAGPVV